MNIQFADLARSAAACGEISPPELLALRQLGWSGGRITRHEAETLLALNRALAQPNGAHASGEWADFFVDALCEFVLGDAEPLEACDECEARWLIGAIDGGGQPVTMAEIELLVRLIERARAVPDSLRHYALQQVEAAVLAGDGPTRVGGGEARCHITGAECRLVRRILFATGGDRAPAPSRPTMETLLGIERATRPSNNSPEWRLVLFDATESHLGRGLAKGETAERVLSEALAGS